MLPGLLEGRAGTTAIAHHALDEIAQIPPSVNRQHIFGNILPDIHHDERDAVHDGIFPQAILVGAVEGAFDDVFVFFAHYLGKAQCEGRAARRAADRTNRVQGFEVPAPHSQPPIITVGQPGGRIFPVGPGMGATQEECSVMSPTRAAGSPPMRTVPDACMIIPGPPGTHPGSRQGPVMSVIRAAGIFPINTVGSPLMIVRGKGGCGTGVGTGAGG